MTVQGKRDSVDLIKDEVSKIMEKITKVSLSTDNILLEGLTSKFDLENWFESMKDYSVFSEPNPRIVYEEEQRRIMLQKEKERLAKEQEERELERQKLIEEERARRIYKEEQHELERERKRQIERKKIEESTGGKFYTYLDLLKYGTLDDIRDAIANGLLEVNKRIKINNSEVSFSTLSIFENSRFSASCMIYFRLQFYFFK